MSKYLFDDFNPITPKAWKQKIQVDLKGDDYNDNLLWNTEENITVKPFYTKEDRTHQNINLPKKGFNICQSVFIDDEKIANSLILDAIKRGATAIELKANKKFDFKKVLKNIQLDVVKVYFNLNFLDASFIINLSEFTKSKNCFFNNDIISNLARTGNWYSTLNEDHFELDKIITKTNNAICVNTSYYQNAGANITQQLAYALSHANEYLNYFGEKIVSKIHFNFSVGSNYFFEIAKLRAFRILWTSLLKEYGFKEKTVHLFTQPTLRNKTLYDHHVNMLRTTSECMSAILGGASTICNSSYDAVFHKSNEFGERMARNQLLILQQESYLKEAQHIANGTYYIESITNQLAENALGVFKLIENGGGFLKQLKEGVIQKKINESALKEQERFNKKELILVGSNKGVNKHEFMKNELELFPFVKRRGVKTLIQPIIQKRLAENLEQERLKDE